MSAGRANDEIPFGPVRGGTGTGGPDSPAGRAEALHGGRDEIALLRAHEASLARVGVQAADADPGRGLAEVAPESRREGPDAALHPVRRQAGRHRAQRNVSGLSAYA